MPRAWRFPHRGWALRALIVMPVATADIKVDAVRGFGGEVLLHGANFDEAKARAIELAQQQGFYLGAAVRSPDGHRRTGEPWRWSCCSRMPILTAYSSRWAAAVWQRRGGADQAN